MAETPTKRIYIVEPENVPEPALPRLVRTTSPARALSHCYTARIATPDECITATQNGVKVEDAKNGSAE